MLTIGIFLAEELTNWSGSVHLTPSKIVHPQSEQDIQKLVAEARRKRSTLRPFGAGHSSSKIIETDQILVSLKNFKGLIDQNLNENEATIGAGLTLKEAGSLLDGIGLATPNLGDVNIQTVGGAIATGTHGSGKNLTNLATMLVGGRMITAGGEVFDFSEEDANLIRAARVSLGAVGIMTQLRLRLLPSYQLHRQEWCTDLDHCLDHLDELVDSNRNFDFYWYPRSDKVKLRTLNPPGEEPDIHYADLVEDVTGRSGEVISKIRTLRFEEMEFSIPAERGRDCFEEVREAIKEKHRKFVGWRLLYRLTAPDNTYLSNAYGRKTVSISLHQNNTLPFWGYFEDIEPIFRSYLGRPHWAKKHTLIGEDLRALYPEWDSFMRVREEMDPEGLFMSKEMRELLGG